MVITLCKREPQLPCPFLFSNSCRLHFLRSKRNLHVLSEVVMATLCKVKSQLPRPCPLSIFPCGSSIFFKIEPQLPLAFSHSIFHVMAVTLCKIEPLLPRPFRSRGGYTWYDRTAIPTSIFSFEVVAVTLCRIEPQLT